MKISPFTLGFVVLMSICTVCSAFPTPQVIQDANQWTLKVKYDQPQQISVRLPGQKAPQRFWYVILTLTNNAGTDAEFYPACDLMTDTYQIVKSWTEPMDRVFEAIKLKHVGSYPYLEPMDSASRVISHRVLKGSDNTRDIAIIWPDFDARAKNITLFIEGLSNETVVIDHPTAKDAQGNAKKVYLRKTLALDFSIAGDGSLREGAVLKYKAKRWVMR